MKQSIKRTALMAAALTSAALLSAEARNVVGYVKIEVPAGLSLMSVPFERIGGGTLTVGEVFGDKLADGSKLYLFKPGVGFDVIEYIVEDDPEDTGWYKGADRVDDMELPRATGFWIRNNAATSVAIVLHGQAPVGQASVSLPLGLQIVSFGFPSDADIQSLPGLEPNDGDKLYEFVDGGFVVYEFIEEEDPQDTGWYKGMTKAVFNLAPGRAYWYRRTGASTTWNQSKNYTF